MLFRSRGRMPRLPPRSAADAGCEATRERLPLLGRRALHVRSREGVGRGRRMSVRIPIKKRRAGVRRGPVGVPSEKWRNSRYLKFLREFGYCAVCASSGCDPCHGPVNGMSSKGPDAEAIPMCREHHNEQTRLGWPKFEDAHGFDRKTIARLWWNSFILQKGERNG